MTYKQLCVPILKHLEFFFLTIEAILTLDIL